MRDLLASIDGLELVEFGEAEQCGGFGGTFSVTFPHISTGMGTVKLDQVLGVDPAPEVMASADISCLMHLGGLARKQQRTLPTLHAVEILRAAMEEGGGA
jgi:L-lactate dehydrogenase complex protein LldE